MSGVDKVIDERAGLMLGTDVPQQPHDAGPEWDIRRGRRRSEVQYFLYFVRTNKMFAAGLAAVALLLFLSAFPDVVATHDPEQADPQAILKPPSAAHLLGTDGNGMDIFSRLVWAPRIDVLIAVASTAIGFALGVPLGAFVGYFAGRKGPLGWSENLAMRGFDVFQAFPIFVLALAIMAVLGRSVTNVVVVLAFLSTPILMRLTRSAVLAVRSKPYVDAARSVGNSELQIVWKHVLPNSLSPALVNASVLTGGAMLITAGLSFVGAGVPAPTPEWGFMVATGAPNMVTGQWWPGLFPGLALGFAVIAFALVGEGLREFLDPTKRR